jgi:hypothetical protein
MAMIPTRMSRDIASRADELSFGFADDAIEEGIYRTEDSVIEGRLHEGQLWLSTIFELIRRKQRRTPPPA